MTATFGTVDHAADRVAVVDVGCCCLIDAFDVLVAVDAGSCC